MSTATTHESDATVYRSDEGGAVWRGVASCVLWLLLLAAPCLIHAQPVSWTGAGDGSSWSDAANWNPQTVPGAEDDVVIDQSSAYTVEVSSSRSVASLRLDWGDATLELGADLAISGAYMHEFGTLEGGGDLTVEGMIDWSNGTMAGSGTTTAGGGVELDDGVLDERRLVVPTGETAAYTGGGFGGRNGGVLEVESGATLDIQTHREMYVASGSTSPPAIVNRGTIEKTVDNRAEISWALENHGTVLVEDGEHLRFEGPIIDAGGTYHADGGDSRLDLWPAASVTFGPSSTLAAGPGATLDLSHSADADTAPPMTIEGTYDVEGTTAMGETHPAAEVTIAASADVQHLGAEGLILGDRGRFIVEVPDPLAVGPVDISSESHLAVDSDLTVEGQMLMDNTSARFESAHDLVVEGAFTWSGGTMAGSGATIAEGGLSIEAGAGSASRNTRLSERRLVLPSGATGSYPGNGALEGGDGAVLEIEPDAAFDLQAWGDFTVYSGSSSPPKVINRGTFKKTAGGSATEVDWALANYGTVEGADDLLRFRGQISDHDGTYRADDARLSLRPPVGDVTFGSGSTIEADAGGTINFGRRSRAEPDDATVTFTVEGSYNVLGATSVRGGTSSAEVVIAASADLQELAGDLLTIGDRDGYLTIETIDPVSVSRVRMGVEGRLTANSAFTVEGTMRMDHTDAHFISAHDLVVEGLFTWNGGLMTGGGTTIARGGLALEAGAGSASHNNRLVDRRLVVPDGATATYPGNDFAGGEGAIFEIESGGVFDISSFGRLAVLSGASSRPQFINRGTIKVHDGGDLRTDWPAENHGTVEVEEGDVHFDGTFTDEGGTYRAATTNSRVIFQQDSSVAFGSNSTIAAVSGGSLVYESNEEFASNGVIEVDGDFDIEADGGATLGPNATVFVETDAQLTYQSDQALETRGAFELDGFLTARERSGPNDPSIIRLLDGGVMSGSGTVTIGHVVNDSGTVRPGGQGAAGHLNILSNYSQGPGGTLELELGGTTSGEGYDRLDAVDIELAGTLQLALLDGFVPGTDDLLRPLQWSGTRAGTFDEIDEQDAGDVVLAVEYGASALHVFDGSLPEPPSAPALMVEVQSPPFSRVGRPIPVTVGITSGSTPLAIGQLETDNIVFGHSPSPNSCPEDDNYENLKCRMAPFGVVPPEPADGESYPRLVHVNLQSILSQSTSNASTRMERQAVASASQAAPTSEAGRGTDVIMTTTRAAFIGNQRFLSSGTASCSSGGDIESVSAEMGGSIMTNESLDRCAAEIGNQILSDLKSRIPGYDCYTLYTDISSQIRSGFRSNFDMAAAMASNVLGALDCAGDAVPATKAIELMQGLNSAIQTADDFKTCFADGGGGGGSSDGAATRCLAAIDPNDKKGPQGVGAEHYTARQDSLPYTVFFENKPEATAPAQKVTVEDTLEAGRFDLSIFSFGSVAFGDTSIVVPQDTAAFSQDVDLRPERDLILRIEGALDEGTGVLSWTFTSLDPSTMQPTTDPTAGFLPPNEDPPEGEGSVSYFADLEENVASGTRFGSAAQIVFDQNDPIETPVWTNVLDAAAPVSQVAPLDSTQDNIRFEVAWSGTDAESGLRSFDVFVSKDGGAFEPWIEDTTAISAVYEGERGSDYAFYSVATDSLGHEEAAPSSADATTHVDSDAIPVELSVFEAKRAGEAVRLSWRTESETGSARFEVQRQTGETSGWTALGSVEAAGTTTEPQTYRFVDEAVPFAADSLRYRLRQVDKDGSAEYSEIVEVGLGVPERLALHENFPNPFRGRTTIRYELPQASQVELVVYDVLGKQVATLIDGRQDSGRKQVRFEAREMPSGVYVVRLTADGRTRAQKITLVR